MRIVRLRGICGLHASLGATGNRSASASGGMSRTRRCGVDIKRRWAAAIVLGTSAGLVGCKSPMGGLAFWNSKQDTAVASAAPDTNRQNYDGLSQEFASSGRPMGSPSKNATPLGGQKSTEKDGTLMTA